MQKAIDLKPDFYNKYYFLIAVNSYKENFLFSLQNEEYISSFLLQASEI